MAVRLPGTPQTWLDEAVFKDEEERYEIELAEARKSGRYPFHVAARLIEAAAGPGANVPQLEERLILAARDRTLPAYTIGQTLRWDGANPFVATLEILADDLDSWLKANEPRIFKIFQFSSPASPGSIVDIDNSETANSTTCDTETAHARPKAKHGLPKNKVMVAFDGLRFDYEHWGRNLASPPNWLIACRVEKGSKKTSALWNPAQIAIALLDKGITVKKLDAVFVGLADWKDEWHKLSAIFRD
jgi:hypothetical protein